ncbi:MAG: hypothetical protein F4W98_04840, partial [Acidimicrobiales bacterium]|nr:hypothetical protein [Acidimicrobiales bacterium]
MMKSPTSLIRFRNAVGVMLAMSAIFAVVISTISIPGDRAAAQNPDESADAITARAAAWWNALDAEKRTNAIFGKDYDHDTDTSDDDPAGESEGRQLPPEASAEYDALVANGTAATGTPPTGGVIGKNNVTALVDGDSDAPGDIYAVGEQIDDTENAASGNGHQALRGFQSVELWWDHLTCLEARIAVGEDNNDPLLDTDTNTDGNQLEDSAVCDLNLNDAGDAIAPAVKAYSDVKSMVDAVGQAILGLDAPGSPSSNDNARAEAWWGKLSGTQRANALYGAVAGAVAVDTDDTATTDVDESEDELHEQARADYDDLNDATKTLVNDRWQWVYNGGSGDDDLAAVISWWNGTSCAQMRTAVGIDNEPPASIAGDGSDYCAMWDGLQADPPVDAGQMRQARVLDVGQAILGTAKPVPQVAAWWNTLNMDQMVYVVYGNPPMRTAYDDPNDDPDAGATVTRVTDEDKAVFQKMYAGLDDNDGIRVDGAAIALNTHLPAYVATMLGRNGLNVDTPTAAPDGDDADTDPDYYYYSAKAIVNALANEIFDPPTMLTAFVRPDGSLVGTNAEDDTTTVGPVADDDDFDWPYHATNGPANVGDWWETTDCRVMRIAVGEDNNYLNGAVEDDAGTTDVDETMDAETSIYCGHLPGAAAANADGSNVLSEMAQERVAEVGAALLGLSVTSNELHAGRPSFNEAAEGDPVIMGTAQVGSPLTVDTTRITDGDRLGDFSYQWLRDGDPISGATGSSYTLTAADAGARISIRVSFVDDERFPEERTSPESLGTSMVVGSPGEISRIEPVIRSVTLSAGDTVILSVDIYGLQNAKDNTLDGIF